jgi:general stress protein YciG
MTSFSKRHVICSSPQHHQYFQVGYLEIGTSSHRIREEKRSLSMDSQQPRTRSLRGFASMDKEKQKEIASKGGRAAHEKGTAHEFNSNEASLAAKKGHERGTAHEFTPDEARIAGRKGGLARAMNRSRNNTSEGSQSSSMSPGSNGSLSPSMEIAGQSASSESMSSNHNPS